MDEAFDINAWSAAWHFLDKDTPGKVWWNSASNHPAIYRALKIDKGQHGALYACSPFRLHRDETGVRIIAAYPAPHDLDEPDHTWLGIETVIAWNPIDDTAVVLGDDAPQIVGNLSEETNVIFASPRAFFQHWARRRAQFLAERALAKAQRWNRAPAERDQTPGALMIGRPDQIRWQPALMPTDLRCRGVNPQEINRELLKAARVPRARGDAA
ncbi:hypothetical protein I5E68_07175 [Novosphingobium sp. YJ-S2-02]|uniref:Uncharacterized protein n=1 Tax=Novosphingobium aureum TaxID=2792964 RepID=A0A931MKB5_9SPHN|nr:hypothetical protein [Novosphingobium aureum]MBH0112732.1 hypothetical protein [Novosphingobium aureum]